MSARLATYRCGRPLGQAPVALLTHGFTDNAASLCDLAARLAGDFHVVAVDLPSHGLSPRLTSNDPIAECAAAVGALAAELAGHGSYGLVGFGHSMGAAVLSLTAASHPALFDALVLDDPAWLTQEQAAAYAAAAPATRRQLEATRADPVGALARLREDYPAWPAAELGGWLAGKLQVDLDFVDRGVVGLPAPPPPTLLPRTLVVTGTGPDVLIGPARAVGLGLPVAVIEGASHTCRRDNAAEFSRLITEFLQGVPLCA